MNKNGFIPTEKLIQYLDGTLSDFEKAAIKRELLLNPELRQRLQEVQNHQDTLEEWGTYKRVRSNMLASLKSKQSVYTSSQTGSYANLFSLRYAAAASFLIAIVSLIYFLSFSTSNLEVLNKTNGVQFTQLNTNEDVKQYKVSTGKEGYLAVRMGDNKSITEFGPNTEATIIGSRLVEVTQGSLYNIVGKHQGEKYSISTPQGTVTVLGTVFEVEVLGEETSVKVQRGLVRLHNNTSKNELLLKRLQMASMSSNQISQPRLISESNIASWRGQEIRTRDMAKYLQ